MDLFVVHHIRQNEGLRNPLGPTSWTNVWTVEAEAMAHAGDSIAKLVGGAFAGVRFLVRALVSLVAPAQRDVQVRVATRQQRVELAARNDDRAAA
jgi:hypothetical protein